MSARYPGHLPPSAALQRYVAGYLDVAMDVPGPAWHTQRVSPPGGAGLTWRWSGEVVLRQDSVPVPVPAMAFTGPLSVGGETGCRGSLRMISVVFTATGAHDLFGLPMHRFADRTVDTIEALGPWVATLASPLAEATTPAARCALLEHALLERVPLAQGAPQSTPSLAARAATQVMTQPTGGSLADVAAALGVNERTLRRHCLREIGLPLKVFARTVRFARAQAFLEADRRRTWSKAAVRFGFADQAHLVREFRHFAGQPPTRIAEAERAYDPVRVRNLQDTGTSGA